MSSTASSLFDRLCEAESPSSRRDWPNDSGYYLSKCRVTAADTSGLIELVRKWVDPEWPSDAEFKRVGSADVEMLPVTAWRSLADLEAAEAVEPLVDVLRSMGDDIDSWAFEELPHVFGMIGAPSIESLTRLAEEASVDEEIRSIAASGLQRVAEHHPDAREQVVSRLSDMMAQAEDERISFNSSLLLALVELGAVEAAESIERAFSANRLDVAVIGNWENVRKELGVEGLGLPMPDAPRSSIDNLRKEMGIGIFSEDAVFGADDVQPEAVTAYYERARAVFSRSPEAQQYQDRYGDIGWFQTLLDFGINYLGETVDLMSLGSVREFLHDFVPRKVSVEADGAAAIIAELTAFWEYVGRVYALPQSPSIIEWLKADDLVAELKDGLSNPANFGMAKSLFSAGSNAGYDMTTEAGMAEFMVAYNQSLTANQSEPAPEDDLRGFGETIVRESPRVGRNDPCPCGSGKKFKKCCR